MGILGYGIYLVKSLTGMPPPLAPASASVKPSQEKEDQQVVEVSVQVDEGGKPAELKAVDGDPALFGPAIDAARQWEYHPRCDPEGQRVPYTTALFVAFDQSGHFEKVRLPIEVGDVLPTQKLLRRVEPEYPDKLKKKGISGAVVLRIRIDQKGEVTEAKAVRGPTPLYESAVRAALQWKFKPYYFRDCTPIPIIATITMTFGTPPIRSISSTSRK